MVSEVRIGELVEHAIGGGWGSDERAPGSTEVAVIRGADFPSFKLEPAGVPRRFEKASKVPQRTLQHGDIVLEISGGTKDRSTGRTVYIPQEALDQFGRPVIPASFCRLLRVDAAKADPLYVYYWLQEMHTSGRAWLYQVQSTGLSNFQFKHFLETELVRLPPIEEQRAIAEVLGALDDRIEWCAGAVGRLEALLLELARGEAAAVPVADLGTYVNGGAYTKHATGAGRLVIRIAELSSGVGPSSKYADIEAPPERTAYPGDILFSWSATLDAYRWTADEAVVNQHIFKVLPSEPWPAWFVYAKLKEAMPTFQKIAHDRATTMGHIKRGHLEQVSVGLPDEAHLEQVRDLGDAIWDQHLRASREQLHLANLRDLLLPRLLSGELRIEEPARLLGAVA
jgi:type I restriction enzyme, S subunit